MSITKVKVVAGVRYYSDCQYSTDNGVTWIYLDDTDENDLAVRGLIPCVEFLEKKRNWYWCFNVDFDEGKIESWKQGFHLKTFFKVCDDGLYQIIDDKDRVVWDSNGYVPNFLEIDSSNFGDNIFITIDGDGFIKDWNIAKDRIRELLDNKQ